MPIFVIQKHNATNLHWDLRLEINGRLKSWAVPKQPPRKKGLKRLAIQVPDHAKSYAKFEGKIPKPLYGAGTVKIWDKGTYKMIEKVCSKMFYTNLNLATDPHRHPQTFSLFLRST